MYVLRVFYIYVLRVFVWAKVVPVVQHWVFDVDPTLFFLFAGFFFV